MSKKILKPLFGLMLAMSVFASCTGSLEEIIESFGFDIGAYNNYANLYTTLSSDGYFDLDINIIYHQKVLLTTLSLVIITSYQMSMII